MTEAANEPATLEVHADPPAFAPVEITIDGDKTETREANGAAAPEAAKEVSAETGIEELKRQVAAERSRADAEARARRESETREANAGRNAIDANLAMVTSAIEAAQAAIKEARGAARKAMEGADYDAALDAQEKMAAHQFNLLRLQEQKAEVERAKAAPPRQPQPADEVERIAGQLERQSPKSAAWVRAHPEMAKTWNKVEAAHRSAVDLDGLEPDTSEYFARVEELLGMRKVAAREERKAEADVIRVRQPAAQAAAPAQRETVSLQNGKSERQTITLSAQEREMAREMGMSDREYALEKIAAIRDGQIKAVN